MTVEISLGVLIGRNLRARRTALNRSLEWTAARFRDFGLAWNASQIAKAERGEREFSVAAFGLIALALDMHPTELLESSGEEMIRLAPDATADVALLRAVFDGTSIGQRIELRGPENFKSPHTRYFREANKAFERYREADERAAKRLDTTPDVVSTAAYLLWNRPFVAEREARLAERVPAGEELSAQQLGTMRGHVSRELIQELRLGVEVWQKAQRKSEDRDS